MKKLILSSERSQEEGEGGREGGGCLWLISGTSLWSSQHFVVFYHSVVAGINTRQDINSMCSSHFTGLHQQVRRSFSALRSLLNVLTQWGLEPIPVNIRRGQGELWTESPINLTCMHGHAPDQYMASQPNDFLLLLFYTRSFCILGSWVNVISTASVWYAAQIVADRGSDIKPTACGFSVCTNVFVTSYQVVCSACSAVYSLHCCTGFSFHHSLSGWPAHRWSQIQAGGLEPIPANNRCSDDIYKVFLQIHCY